MIHYSLRLSLLLYFFIILTFTNCRGIRIDCNTINFKTVAQSEKDSLVAYFVNHDSINGFSDLGLTFKDSAELLMTKKIYQNALKEQIDSIFITPVDIYNESALFYLLAIRKGNHLIDSLSEFENNLSEGYNKEVYLIMKHKDKDDISGSLLVSKIDEFNNGLSWNRTTMHSFLKPKKIVVIKEKLHGCDICFNLRHKDLYSRSREIWMIDQSNMFKRR